MKLYIKSCIQGAAAKKDRSFLISEDNYKEVWTVLKNSYEKRRIIINKYFETLINLTSSSSVTSESFSDIANTVNQCVNLIKNLGINFDVGLERAIICKNF